MMVCTEHTESQSVSVFDSAVHLSHPVLCLVGPTASGKTAVSQELALLLDAEIVSADSMQVYRGMDIGTGKILPSEQRVKHWGLDLCDPDEPYSAALFQTYARRCFSDIDKRGKRVILCGGTRLYVCAAIDDYHFPSGDQRDNEVRDSYTKIAEDKGPQALWDMLYQVDPQSATLIHPNNVRRVVRAFEMLHEGIRYADQQKNLSTLQQLVPACFIGLEVSVELLNKRIDERVDAMLADGLVDEVKNLLQHGLRGSITAPQAIGYKEIVDALDGRITFDDAVRNIKVATHRYAKRQRTWFRKDTRITWINADSKQAAELAREALTMYEEDSATS